MLADNEYHTLAHGQRLLQRHLFVEFLHMLNDIADLIDNSDHLGTWNIFS